MYFSYLARCPTCACGPCSLRLRFDGNAARTYSSITVNLELRFTGSNFVISQRHRSVQQTSSRSNSRTSLQMGSQAKFGVFSPAVYAAKIALGNDKLNKFRGQAISLHSQYIGDFCTWAGAYHLRTRLIKKVRWYWVHIMSLCRSRNPGSWG